LASGAKAPVDAGVAQPGRAPDLGSQEWSWRPGWLRLPRA